MQQPQLMCGFIHILSFSTSWLSAICLAKFIRLAFSEFDAGDTKTPSADVFDSTEFSVNKVTVHGKRNVILGRSHPSRAHAGRGEGMIGTGWLDSFWRIALFKGFR